MRLLRTFVGMVLVAALSASCSDGPSEPGPEPRRGGSSPSAPTGAPALAAAPEMDAAPAGFRWVGMNDVVVAVPEGWGTQTEACASPDGDTVHFVGQSSLVMDCASIPTYRVSSLTVAAISSGAIPLGRKVDLAADVEGLRVLHSGTSCRTSAHGPCRLTFAAPGADVVFQVHYLGPRPRPFVADVLDSVRRLPSDLVTVPFFDYGTSVEDVEGLLSDAGLTAVVQELEGPHYATGTRPPAGTVVPVGEEVVVTVGDG